MNVLVLTRCVIIVLYFGAMAGVASGLAPRILVLGGTGFIGSTVTKIAVRNGFEVTSLSRRGAPSPGSHPVDGVTWLTGDATDPAVLHRVIKEGEYDGVVHAIGMLFAGSLNRFASGSGSVPDPGTTYDKITRQTAFAATAALENLAKEKGGAQRPFVFISAAEAKWGFDGIFEGTPVGWLHDYLIAKRAVEDELLNNKPSLRGVVLRPSLVWTKSRPGSLLPVAAFQMGSRIGIPGIDRPVHVETLASAAVESLLDSTVVGIQNWEKMEDLYKRHVSHSTGAKRALESVGGAKKGFREL